MGRGGRIGRLGRQSSRLAGFGKVGSRLAREAGSREGVGGAGFRLAMEGTKWGVGWPLVYITASTATYHHACEVLADNWAIMSGVISRLDRAISSLSHNSKIPQIPQKYPIHHSLSLHFYTSPPSEPSKTTSITKKPANSYLQISHNATSTTHNSSNNNKMPVPPHPFLQPNQ